MLADEILIRLKLTGRLVRPIDEMNHPCSDVRSDGRHVVVFRSVLIQIELLDPRKAMELDPLAEIGRLISEDGTNSDVHRISRPGWSERALKFRRQEEG